VVSSRHGTGKLGCLFSLLLFVTAGYSRSDEEIRRRLAALADSLGLPEEAARVAVRRSANVIRIRSAYVELVELPLFVRSFHLEPSASGPL
jgi:hypothetical protein